MDENEIVLITGLILPLYYALFRIYQKIGELEGLTERLRRCEDIVLGKRYTDE